MDTQMVVTLQKGIEQELARRFDHDDAAMAEYIVVMLQNGKDAPAISEELSDLISNYDTSFTTWIFQQSERLRAGHPIEVTASKNLDDAPEEAMDMETDIQIVAAGSGEPGMGYPSSRLYSDIKKTLHENGTDHQQTRHRPDSTGVRSTPYGTVAVGNGAMKVPTGPRADEGNGNKASAAGPMRTNRGRGSKSISAGRYANTTQNGIPEMPQFPGFPIDPSFFANMPLMDRIGGIDSSNSQGPRPPSRRCTKWPTCFKGKACTFGHPTSMCQKPTCRRTDGTCVNVHSDEDVDLLSGVEAQRRTEEEQEAKAAARDHQYRKPKVELQQPKPDVNGAAPICRFGEACTNRTCHFAHPSPVSKNGSSIVLSSDSCPAGMECKDENCSLSHPSPSNQYTPGVKLNTMSSEVFCKFQPCLNPSCRFQHGPGQKSQIPLGGARNKVWTPNSATSTSERKFVAAEVEEQFNPESNVHDNDTEMEK